MSQSLAKNVIHLIFSTKNRVPIIGKAIRPQLDAYHAGILTNLKCPPLIAGSVEDHVHLLFMLSKNLALAEVVEELKKGSSKWIKTQGPEFRDFRWQAGYAAFSVSESNVPRVKKYIANQEEHHRKLTFQDELRKILSDLKLDFDERYLWD